MSYVEGRQQLGNFEPEAASLHFPCLWADQHDPKFEQKHNLPVGPVIEVQFHPKNIYCITIYRYYNLLYLLTISFQDIPTFPFCFAATRTAPCAATQRSRARLPCGATSCPWAASGTRPAAFFAARWPAGWVDSGGFFPGQKSTNQQKWWLNQQKWWINQQKWWFKADLKHKNVVFG